MTETVKKVAAITTTVLGIVTGFIAVFEWWSGGAISETVELITNINVYMEESSPSLPSQAQWAVIVEAARKYVNEP